MCVCVCVRACASAAWCTERWQDWHIYIITLIMCICAAGLRPPQSEDCSGPSQAAITVVAIETRICVPCVCVWGTQTCPTDRASLVSGEQTRHDPSESLYHLGRRHGGGSSLLVAEMLRKETVWQGGLWDIQLWKRASLCPMYFIWRHKGLQAFKLSILVPLVPGLRAEQPDMIRRECVCVCSEDGTEVNATK